MKIFFLKNLLWTPILSFVLIPATHILILVLAFILTPVSITVFTLLLTFVSTNLTAGPGISVATGIGTRSIVPARLGLQYSFDQQWCVKSRYQITSYLEASAYHFHGKRGPNPFSPKSMNGGFLAGVMRVQSKESYHCLWPYMDIGFGAGYVGKREISSRELGIHFQFEDRFGLGVRFGENKQYDLCYRLTHFSNAYLGPKNHGFNLHLIVLGYWF